PGESVGRHLRVGLVGLIDDEERGVVLEGRLEVVEGATALDAGCFLRAIGPAGKRLLGHRGRHGRAVRAGPGPPGRRETAEGKRPAHQNQGSLHGEILSITPEESNRGNQGSSRWSSRGGLSGIYSRYRLVRAIRPARRGGPAQRACLISR